MRRRVLAAFVCVAAPPVTAIAVPPPHIVYAPVPVTADLAALSGALIQGPARTSASWPRERQMPKVRASELLGRDAGEMARLLRGAIRARPGAGVVGVDELSSLWSAQSAAALEAALRSLGPERERVVLYAAASTVGGIGRVDPRRPLDARQAAVMGAASQAGALYLETYYGNRNPIGDVELATWLTRWKARWPGRPDRLRLILGPSVPGFSQADSWRRARSSPAGRSLLANGAAVWGLREPGEARAWLDGLRAFQAAPLDAPAGGDARIASGGGLTLARHPRGGLLIGLARPARAVVQLLRPGASDGRVFRKLNGPFAPTRIALPPDTRRGRYVVRVIAIGDGLRDEARLEVRVSRPR